MRKLFFVIVMIAASLQIFAKKDVTKFLGIPVDGTKTEMIRKLKAKGFKSKSLREFKDVLVGEFNGKKSNIHVVTNRNKVYRIMVSDDDYVDESQIRVAFNNLMYQFKTNPNYYPYRDTYIDEEEDISYQMAVNNKIYEGAFWQKSASLDDTADPNKFVWFMIAEFYGKYSIFLYYDNEYNKSHGEDL